MRGVEQMHVATGFVLVGVDVMRVLRGDTDGIERFTKREG